jgi:hypothetical protein
MLKEGYRGVNRKKEADQPLDFGSLFGQMAENRLIIAGLNIRPLLNHCDSWKNSSGR